MLTKLIKNFFAACYLGLAKSAKQLRKVRCVALCLAIALGLINLPAQTVDAKGSSWYVLPNSSPKVVRISQWQGGHLYLRMISIKEAKSWGVEVALPVSGTPGAYVVKATDPNFPTYSRYYPLDFSHLDISDGTKILLDDKNNSLPVREGSSVPILNIDKSQVIFKTFAEWMHEPTKAEMKQTIEDHMKMNIAGIKPYRTSKDITKPTLNALVDSDYGTGDERFFTALKTYREVNGEWIGGLEYIKYDNSDDKVLLMPLISGANISMDVSCRNDCKTVAAKGVRLRVTYPKTAKAGEIVCFTAKLWGKNLSQSPIVNKVYAVAPKDVKITMLPYETTGLYSEFPKEYKSFVKKVTSAKGALLGCDTYIGLEGNGTIPAGKETDMAFSFKVTAK